MGQSINCIEIIKKIHEKKIHKEVDNALHNNNGKIKKEII